MKRVVSDFKAAEIKARHLVQIALDHFDTETSIEIAYADADDDQGHIRVKVMVEVDFYEKRG